MQLFRNPFERNVALPGYAAIAVGIGLLALVVIRFGAARRAHPVLLGTADALLVAGALLRRLSELLRLRTTVCAAQTPPTPDPNAARPLSNPDLFPPREPVL